MRTLSINETFILGSYPQDIVTDTEIIKAAHELCGKPSKFDRGKWQPYANCDCRGYVCDFTLSNNKYRCVLTEKYDPHGFYKINGYAPNKLYVFEYTPITWRVLSVDERTALAVSEKCLDVRPYCNDKRYKRDNERYVDGAVVYMNNYKHSDIREWLNTTFFDTAFDENEKTQIAVAEVNNGAETTKKIPNVYSCENTSDRVFLLSYAEAAALFADNISRQKRATEYVKAQGGYAYATHDKKYNNSCWWLRSPDRNYCNFVRCVGDGGGIGDGGFSCANEPADGGESVVPAISVIMTD